MSQGILAPIAKTETGVAAFLKVDGAGNLLVQQGQVTYTAVSIAANQTKQVLGSGKVGDIVGSITIIPTNWNPGKISLFDGQGGSEIVIFVGGDASTIDLRPLTISVNLQCAATVNPGWYITTGTDITALVAGQFN